MSKTWSVSKNAPDNYKKQFKGFDDIVVQMLYNRLIKNKKEAEEFFNPDYKKMHDPYLLKDMGKAVKRIIKSLEKKEKITVFGDYDVDGITSTAIVFDVLKKLNANVDFYIPHRNKEGYGINKDAIDLLAKEKTNLLITVDNGISNKNEILYAKKKGIEVVLTDHHEVPKIIPDAIAVVNPKQKDDKYPFKNLSGVGVAFKLVCALVSEVNKKNKKELMPLEQLKWYLDLVALGTISDIVPLLGENRIIAFFGLIVLAKTKNVGLKALEKIAGIDLEKGSPHMIGFQIGPRLNAAGRMAHAKSALDLILAEDENEAGVLALKLERLNQERQNTISDVVNGLKVELAKNKLENILILRNEDWTAGIIGLIAGKISDEFSRPVFCMAEEAGIIKGSVRSSVDFNVVESLSVFEEILINYGGHYGAGGFSLKEENFNVFQEQLLDWGRKELKENDLKAKLDIEKEIELKDINFQFLEQIKRFAPFGHSNPEPLFLTKGVLIKEAKKVGKESNHTKLRLFKDDMEFSAILFNHGEMGEQLIFGNKIDIVYKIEENEWSGNKKLELKIEDLRS